MEDKIQGVLEIRPLARKLYGVRVAGGLTYKLKKVDAFTRAGTGSNFFAFTIPEGTEDNLDSAKMEFIKIVKGADLGSYFGIPGEEKEIAKIS